MGKASDDHEVNASGSPTRPADPRPAVWGCRGQTAGPDTSQVSKPPTYGLRSRELSRADVNAVLTVFMLALVVPYSSGVQQPMRVTAVLNRRLHTRRAAPVEREQARASSLHPEGQCSAGYGYRSFMMCALCLLYHSGSSACE